MKKSFFKRLTDSVNTLATKSYASAFLPWFSYTWADEPEALIEKGYKENSAAFHSIDKIGQKCGEIPLKLYRKDAGGGKTEIENHPILELLYSPNKAAGTYDNFVKQWVSYLKITGTSYFYKDEAILLRNRVPEEIFVLPSQLVTSKYDNLGRPIEFKITQPDNTKKVIKPNEEEGVPTIQVTRNFNPKQEQDGLSPLGPLKHAIMLVNETNDYSVNFVKNRCTPPGILTTEKSISSEQREQLQKTLMEKYSGPGNAGIPMITWGGFHYEPMTGNGSEQVSVFEGQLDREREIARTLGVPPMLLGIPGDSTYNNLLEAKKEFVLSTCYPLMKLFAAALTNWLLKNQNEMNLYLEPCIDDMPEIMEYRAKSLSDLEMISYLSINEKRAMAGFDSFEGDVYEDLLINAGVIMAQDYDLFSEIGNVEAEDDEQTESGDDETDDDKN